MDEKKNSSDTEQTSVTASVSVTDTRASKSTVNVEKIGNAVRISTSK